MGAALGGLEAKSPRRAEYAAAAPLLPLFPASHGRPRPRPAYRESPARRSGAASLELGWASGGPPDPLRIQRASTVRPWSLPRRHLEGRARIPGMQGFFLMFLAWKCFQNPLELFLEEPGGGESR